MAAFLLYVVKASVLLTLLYSLFALLLRNETFHWFNRIVLLAILFLSLVVPLVPVTLAHPVIASAPLAQAESWVRLNEFTVTSQSTASTPVHISGVWILSALYLLGVAFCMFQFLRSLLSLALFIHFGTRVCMDEVPGQMHLMVKPGLSSPFSWMRWIVVSPADLQQDFRPILLHETAHARLCHSLDLVLCQLVCCLLWFFRSYGCSVRTYAESTNFRPTAKSSSVAFQPHNTCTCCSGRPSATNNMRSRTISTIV